MEKLKLHSPDFTEENIAKLAELFPGCVTEAEDENGQLKKSIDFDQLRQELSNNIVEGPQERYHLNWPGKREALLTANAPIAKTLRPCRQESVDFDTTKNLFIEGDNLDALKLLQETYLGKVKMIYIDPPYNTGKQFIYEDDFSENTESYLYKSNQKNDEGLRMNANTESNGRFHSDWLTMMYSRLKLAKNILTDDGAIFISIDDNELDNLKKLCDEIFGESNFLSKIIVQSNKRGQTYKEIAKCHEYILVYYKSNESTINEIEKKSGALPYKDKYGDYDLWELRNRNPKFGRYNRPNLYYPVYVNPNSLNKEGLSEISLEKSEDFHVEVFPMNSEGVESCWRWMADTLKKEGINSDPKVVWAKQKRDGGWNIYEKSRKNTTKVKSIWADTSVISEQGTVESGKLNMGGLLEFPKPIELVKRCIKLGTNESDLVMDFFAGSATTAHAAMKLNNEDSGKRKFVMVQIPELCDENSSAYKAGYKTIAEVSKERIRRAGKKIKEDNADKEGIDQLDIGFRVLKVDTSNMNDVYYSPDEFKHDDLFAQIDNIREDRSAEDLLFQVLLDWGVDLTLPIRKETIQGKDIFIVDENALVACFDTGVDEALVKTLAGFEPLRVVFRDNGFASDAVKINVEQIFKQLSPATEVKSI